MLATSLMAFPDNSLCLGLIVPLPRVDHEGPAEVAPGPAQSPSAAIEAAGPAVDPAAEPRPASTAEASTE